MMVIIMLCIFALFTFFTFNFSLCAANIDSDSLLSEIADPPPYVHRFVYYTCNDHDVKKIAELAYRLNDQGHFKEAKEHLLEYAKRGDWHAISFLFDPDLDEEKGGNYKRLFPDKSAKELLLEDFQAYGLNANAYEYYLYNIRPFKEELAPALRKALKAGFQKGNIIENIFWQLFNDIRDIKEKERLEEWMRCFKKLQSLAYQKGIFEQIKDPFLTGDIY